MTTFQVLYWHDIPLQVRAKGGDGRASAQLSERFQEAVDQAAMAAGLIGSDDYSEALHWSDPEERDGTAREVVAAVAAELEQKYATIDWRGTVASLRLQS